MGNYRGVKIVPARLRRRKLRSARVLRRTRTIAFLETTISTAKERLRQLARQLGNSTPMTGRW